MKQHHSRILVLFMAIVFSFSMLTGCGNAGEPASTRTVTDAMGNVVEVPADLSRIGVTPLPWSSVIFAIDGSSERMVSINPGAMTSYTGSFFEKLDAHYATLDISSIGANFSINMEEMVNRGVEVMVIWDRQPNEAEILKELGIVPIMVRNNTFEDLLNSFAAVGQMLGKENRAQQFIDLYTETKDYLMTFSQQVAGAEKPRVLFLRDTTLRLQGNNHFIAEALNMAGADNIASAFDSITMEEILVLDPEIILMSNFDAFVPFYLYENRIDGQDWSAVSAVVNRRVYKVPEGIYRWDAPGVETPLMRLWLAQLIQPEIFVDLDIERETAVFFQSLFDYTLAEDDLALIFAKADNAYSE